jgi:hypothetical protein
MIADSLVLPTVLGLALVVVFSCVLGIAGTLTMTWAFRHDGPIWVTLCGYVVAGIGWAAVLIAIMP